MFFILLFISVLGLKSQVNCPLNTPEFPFTSDDSWNTYSWSVNLYHPNQMGGAKSINSISFRLDNDYAWGNYTYNNVRIWVRNSNITNYASSPGYPGNVGFIQVFNGNITFNGTGVYTVNFSSPFSYDGTSHYEVLFENRGGTDNTSEEPWFDRTNATPAGVFSGKVGWGTSWSNAQTISSNRRFNLQIDNLGCGSIPLPVSLTESTLNCLKDYVSINWATSSEINNDYFIVKGSDDTENWEILKKIEGAGNSRSTNNYKIKAENKFKYYRLSQKDYDGSYKELVTFVSNCKQERKFSVHPNPASDFIKIEIRNEINSIQLFNIYGQEADGYKLNGNQLDVSALSKGVYVLKINGASKQVLIQ